MFTLYWFSFERECYSLAFLHGEDNDDAVTMTGNGSSFLNTRVYGSNSWWGLFIERKSTW